MLWVTAEVVLVVVVRAVRGWLRAAPTLANGAPAAGTIFRTTIIFSVPQ